jgi:hypothetical protein
LQACNRDRVWPLTAVTATGLSDLWVSIRVPVSTTSDKSITESVWAIHVPADNSQNPMVKKNLAEVRIFKQSGYGFIDGIP